MTRSMMLAIAMSACGGGGDSNPPGSDGPVPATITITGTAEVRSATSSSPAEGVLVEAFSADNDTTVVASTTTDAQGNYTLVVMPNGAALDGFLKATKSGLLDTYLYPPEPLAGDFDGASVNMLAQNTFDLLSSLCSGNQDPAKGTIAVLVLDSTDTEVAGAAVTSSPAASKTCYSGGSGLPSGSATVTGSDGLAYLFNVTGSATVGADKAGSTFQSHGVVSRAGALTTTLVH